MADPASLGFVILSYDQPQQLLRLTETLGRLYDDPPIVCHHNFSQCALVPTQFPPYVRFVQPHLQTGWGTINTVRAGLQALALLYRDQRPDWFVLLSGSDYPVATAARVVDDLRQSGAAAFIDMQELDPVARPAGVSTGSGSAGHGGFNKPGWSSEAFGRYHPTVHVPWPGGGSGRLWTQRPVDNAALRRIMARLQNTPRILGGDPWFTASFVGAKAVLDSSARGRVDRYLRKREIPEEAYYQTLFAHAGVPIHPGNFRYTYWPKYNSKSPDWLTADDLPAIFASGAHFARKFKPQEPALDSIDRELGLR